jgi:hypothetical protein
MAMHTMNASATNAPFVAVSAILFFQAKRKVFFSHFFWDRGLKTGKKERKERRKWRRRY